MLSHKEIKMSTPNEKAASAAAANEQELQKGAQQAQEQQAAPQTEAKAEVAACNGSAPCDAKEGQAEAKGEAQQCAAKGSSQNFKCPIKKRLEYFPVNFYAIVMGLSGWTLATHAVLDNEIIHMILGTLATIAFVLITIIYIMKVYRHWDAVKEESNHPVKLAFFPAISISLLLLSSVWIETFAADTLFLLGCTLQLVFTLFVVNSLIHKKFSINHVNPAWFIPVAGPLIVPLAGMQLDYNFISVIAYPIGFIFWILLFTILLYRLVFHDPLPPKLVPMLCIMLAPPSVAALSYFAIDRAYGGWGGVGPVALMLYGIAWFIFVFLLTNIKRFINAPFFLSAWAYSFPIAAFIIATAKIVPFFIERDYLELVFYINYALIGLFSVLIIYLIARTSILIKEGKICVPE